jgi:hypothetical protein
MREAPRVWRVVVFFVLDLLVLVEQGLEVERVN